MEMEAAETEACEAVVDCEGERGASVPASFCGVTSVAVAASEPVFLVGVEGRNGLFVELATTGVVPVGVVVVVVVDGLASPNGFNAPRGSIIKK